MSEWNAGAGIACPACHRPYVVATIEARENDPLGRPRVRVYSHVDGTSCVEPRRKVRVVVIDDEPDVLEVTRLTLEEVGYEVTPAADSAQGLAAINKVEPDLVLIDHGTDASAVVEQLEQRAIADRPAVVVSSGGPPKLPEAACVKAWLPRPYTAEQLKRVCALALGVVR
jgi:CheY-like chemotaxis protein